MTKDELEQHLIRLIGPGYINYPICVEWNIKMLKYLKEHEKQGLIKNGNTS